MTMFGTTMFTFMANSFYLLVGLICILFSGLLLYGVCVMIRRFAEEIRSAARKGHDDEAG